MQASLQTKGGGHDDHKSCPPYFAPLTGPTRLKAGGGAIFYPQGTELGTYQQQENKKVIHQENTFTVQDSTTNSYLI